jgi:hypothetical protein
MSIRRAYSSNPFIDGLFGISAALSYRMSSHFAFAAVARDFNDPSGLPLPEQGGVPILPARYVLATAFRPTGKRSIEAGFDRLRHRPRRRSVPRQRPR